VTYAASGAADPTVTAVGFLFGGLPAGWLVLFTVALVVVVTLFAWTATLYVRAERWMAAGSRRAESGQSSDEPELRYDDYLWVFVVPALNEAVTIRDSVSRLLNVDVARRRIVVVDDGSDDATPQVLATLDHPDVRIIRRDPPNAQLGKAAALNHAYSTLDVGDHDRSRVVLTVVDADGRLAPDAPRHISRHLTDPTVGAVQAVVRIYNRHRILTWFQDLEFGVFGYLFQAGRNSAGTAGMGGNGQFNRLSALDDIAEDGAPWRDRLTEDQDLGLRLVARGWKGRQDLHATVDQQGLSKLRPLLRQRTRWSQGNLQALDLTGEIRRAPFPFLVRAEVLLNLWMPILQAMVGVPLAVAIVLAITGVTPVWGDGPTWYLAVMYLLMFGSTVLGCVVAMRDQGGRLLGFLVAHAYAFYTWLLWPVLARSVARQLSNRLDWAKTSREPISGRFGRSGGRN
jgi:cellulose synthase/poly-beta-1,6-N-acetylglucosamine synthase-like glycosyltransferase